MAKTNLIHRSGKLSRVLEVATDSKTLVTPAYFPAISTFGIKTPFSHLLFFLKHHKCLRVLVSAYDLFHMKDEEQKAALSLMEDFRRKGFLFLDSGLFESSWKNDQRWNIDSYKSMLSQGSFDLYSSFDIYRNEKVDYSDFKRQTYDNILESSVFLDNVVFFAILHESSRTQLMKLVTEFAKERSNLCGNIAVAERDIGKGLRERAETILQIRRTINENDCRSLLHVLGCGDPISMLVYAYCGADTFDSLDWIKFVIDPASNLLRNFAHLELFECKCRVCTREPYRNAEYLEKVLLHNLLFYRDFCKQLQSLICNDNLKMYLQKHVGKEIVDQIDDY